MAGNTHIQWTDKSWNPIVGCSIVSPGCTNCYAMKMAARIEKMREALRPGDVHGPMTHYDGTTKKVNGNAVWTGKVAQAPDHILTAPLHWRKPCKIFVNSMGDLFHESVPDEWIDKVFAVMALCPQHTFQVLTKRAERMRLYCSSPLRRNEIELEAERIKPSTGLPVSPKWSFAWPLKNVWKGVSCERQQEADERIPFLRDTPAAVRFISFEPLLGHIEPDLHGIHWAIAGGESGPDARPMHPKWPRRLRNVCVGKGVAFFFKQWGAWAPHDLQPGGDLGGDVRAGRVRIVHPTAESDVEVSIATGGRSTIPGSRYMARVGKKAAGRLLDGREHNEFPVIDGSAPQSGLSLPDNKTTETTTS